MRSKTVNQRVTEGCGQGTGTNYQPAIWIADFSSTGTSTQSLGWKTNRLHHCLSGLEFRYFYILEWSPIVVDIREQFPLDLSSTQDIAADCGFKHPTNTNTKDPNQMTTDFLITIKGKIGEINQARTIKPADQLENSRVLEKLEIERRYWAERSISWGIVTEHEIPNILSENIEWLHNSYYPQDLAPLTERDVRHIATELTKGIATSVNSLKDIAAHCDDRLSLEPGSSLLVARHLIATRSWLVDLNYPLSSQFRTTLKLLSTLSTEKN